jgi:hypothetical protein
VVALAFMACRPPLRKMTSMIRRGRGVRSIAASVDLQKMAKATGREHFSGLTDLRLLPLAPNLAIE